MSGQAVDHVWTSRGPPGQDRALAIDPTTPGTLYAGTSAGVFERTDAGATWVAPNPGLPEYNSVLALAIDPITPRTPYAGTADGAFKSTDAGAIWESSHRTRKPVLRPAHRHREAS